MIISLPTIILVAFSVMANASTISKTHHLKWDVYLSPPTPAVVSNYTDLSFSPTAFTLIQGEKEAVLVDLAFTVEQTELLVDWLEEKLCGKRLKYVYITHGHGDHFLGFPILQKRFPAVKVLATSHTIEHAQEQLTPALLDDFWGVYFPKQIDPAVKEIQFEAVPSSGKIDLEGHTLQVVDVGHTDTYSTTVLYVKDLDLVVTGDTVYGELYQYMPENESERLRKEWIANIDKVAALKPKYVVPSHHQPGERFGIEHFVATQEYIRVFGAEKGKANNATELFDAMKAKYPKRIGDFILLLSCLSAFPAAAK